MNFILKKLSYTKNEHWKALLFSACLMGSVAANAQNGSIGIGTNSPDESAILDLSSSSKGLLLPRLTLEQKGQIDNPAQGLIIYQTDFLSGLYIFNGDAWSALGVTEAKLSTADAGTWGTLGNLGTNELENFIGTTDNTSLIFKVNNTLSGRIDPSKGNLFFGYKAAETSLGYNSVVLGALAMQAENSSGNNIAIGFQSMYSNETGGDNVAIGRGALAVNSYGEKNVSIGSLSGYKSTGSHNVFLGYQAGYEELGSNKLIIDNSPERTPLVYGDFSLGKIGFNTQDLQSTVNIMSAGANTSGLRFVNLNSNSLTQNSNGKVLSLNEQGEVILTNDLQGSSVVNQSEAGQWSLVDDKIENNNAGLVVIKNNLNINQHTWSNAATIGAGGLYLTNLGTGSSSNGKSLTIDDAGRVFLSNNTDAGARTSGTLWSQAGDIIFSTENQKIAIGGGIPSLPGDYSLYVKNGILAERLRVALIGSEKWADYVFADDYKLMPLNEVEKFIDENNHLPNVRSDKQIAKEGIDMAEMAAKQMEKIEELTLYMIEANKRIDRLEALLAKK